MDCYVFHYGIDFAVLIISVVKCEVSTHVYGNEVCEIYDSDTMIGDLEYFKVLNYSKTHSEVYFVSEGKKTGHIVVFTKEYDIWNVNSWKTIWYKSCSADGFVWPYIRRLLCCTVFLFKCRTNSNKQKKQQVIP